MRNRVLIACSTILALALLVQRASAREPHAGQPLLLRLTQDGHFKQTPDWSPDGKRSDIKTL